MALPRHSKECSWGEKGSWESAHFSTYSWVPNEIIFGGLSPTSPIWLS